MPEREKPTGVADILPAKVSPPRITGACLRTRLFDLLDSFTSHPVTWISAPAGAGKTTLVASYLGARKENYLWYQLDEQDADLATFFFYLRQAALNRTQRQLVKLPSLTPEYLATPAIFAKRFFEALFSFHKRPSVIVLDNYQEIPADAPLHTLLANNFVNLTTGIRIIVLSREEAPSAWARARANGMIARLGWDDLKLTESEANSLVRNRTNGESVAMDKVRLLHTLTHGWAAGMVLLLDDDAITHFDMGPESMERAEQATFDYFAQEILAKQLPSIQLGLRSLAWLPAITPTTAKGLTGDDRIDCTLAELADSRTFTYRHGQKRTTYQFHPLFRAFLQRHARESLGVDELIDLKRRTAAALMATGEWNDAAALLIEAADWGSLVALIERHAPVLIAHGRHQTLETWIRAVPVELLDRSPSLWLHLGTTRFPYDLVESRQHYERAFAQFERTSDLVGQILAWSGIVEAIYYHWSDAATLAPWIAIAEERFVSLYDTIEDKTLGNRIVVGMFVALMFNRPHHPDMALWTSRMEALVRSIPDESQRILIGAPLAQYYTLWIGDFARSCFIFDLMRPSRPGHLSPMAEVIFHTMRSIDQFRQNRLTEALASATTAQTVVNDSGLGVMNLQLTAIFGYIAAFGQDYTRATKCLETLSSQTSMQFPLHVMHREVMASWFSRIRGDYRTALAHARRLGIIVEKHGGPLELLIGYAELVYALYACGAPEEAFDYAHRALSIARDMHSPWYICLSHIGLAHLFLSEGDLDACDRHLRDGFGIARSNDYVAFPFVGPAALAPLCARAIDNGIEPEYVRSLIATLKLRPVRSPLSLTKWPWPLQVFTLGRFQIIRDNAPVEFPVRGQRKPLDLLKALIAFGGRDVDVGTLSEAVWSDAEADAAHAAFKINLHRLRKLIGEEALVLREGRLSLDTSIVWLDVWTFDALLSSQGSNLPERERNEAALSLYKGPFLAGDSRCPWTVVPRYGLRDRFLAHLLQHAHKLLEAESFREAILWFERGLEVEPLSEELYRGLMKCYAKTGRHAEALVLFERCRASLAAAMNIAPSPDTLAVYEQLIAEIQSPA